MGEQKEGDRGTQTSQTTPTETSKRELFNTAPGFGVGSNSHVLNQVLGRRDALPQGQGLLGVDHLPFPVELPKTIRCSRRIAHWNVVALLHPVWNHATV